MPSIKLSALLLCSLATACGEAEPPRRPAGTSGGDPAEPLPYVGTVTLISSDLVTSASAAFSDTPVEYSRNVSFGSCLPFSMSLANGELDLQSQLLTNELLVDIVGDRDYGPQLDLRGNADVWSMLREQDASELSYQNAWQYVAATADDAYELTEPGISPAIEIPNILRLGLPVLAVSPTVEAGTFSRGASLELRWNSDAADAVFIAIAATDTATDEMMGSTCLVRDNGQFTVPGSATATLPLTASSATLMITRVNITDTETEQGFIQGVGMAVGMAVVPY